MEQLGIEPTLLLAQIINFAIIIVVLTKLLYKPILTMLEKRKHEIEEGLALTERMRAAEEKLKVKQDKLMDQARKDAQEMLEQAQKDAKAEAHNIVSAGHKEVEAMRIKAKADMEEQRRVMEKDVEKHAVDLAVAMTKRLLAAILTPQDQRTLIAKHLKLIEKEMK